MRQRDLVVLSVESTMLRTASDARTELRRGLRSLATIATAAPIFGAAWMFVFTIDAFRGCSGDRWHCFLGTLLGLMYALPYAAAGIAVGVPALCAYRYFSERAEDLEVEMRNASSELLTWVDGQLAVRAALRN